MTGHDRPEVESRFELAKVALGDAAADLAIVNGNTVNVYTGEVLTGDCILIKGRKIAFASKYTKRGIGPNTKIIDAAGKVLVPGFIDGHTHMDYLYSSSETARFAMKTGTTTIITETSEIAFRLGYHGIIEYLKSTRDQAVKFWFTLPPMGTISPIAREHVLNLNEVRRLLRRDDCVGLGEIYWGLANTGDKHQLDFIEETLRAGKKVEGHSAGASANKLQGYIDLGISSDHEPITAEEALERLRAGLSVMVREGEVRQDLEAVSQIKDAKIDFRRLAVSTDGVGPRQLITQGFMDHLIQRAVELGFPPVQAIQMGTLNVAEHFNLDDFIGGIAPGRFADIVMIPDIETIKPEAVVSNGQVVFQNGKVLIHPPSPTYRKFIYHSLNLKRDFAAQEFSVPIKTNNPSVKVRVIDQLTKLLTREAILELPVTNGQIGMDLSGGIIKVAAIEYIHTGGQTFTGFIRGLGLLRGAVASSTCWDLANLVVAGESEADMALAVNRIKEMGGGAVVCLNGHILAEVAFPIGSLISAEPMENLAEEMSEVQTAAMKLGCTSPDIRTTLSVLTTPAIPYLRICESGLFNIRFNSFVDLIVE